MSAQELLTDLQSKGIQITADGDRLKIKAPRGTVTPELRERLAAHKPDILAALSMPSRPELDSICRRAVRDYPHVDTARLRRFLEVAQDPHWCTERVARHIARRMAEGLIREGAA